MITNILSCTIEMVSSMAAPYQRRPSYLVTVRGKLANGCIIIHARWCSGFQGWLRTWDKLLSRQNKLIQASAQDGSGLPYPILLTLAPLAIPSSVTFCWQCIIKRDISNQDWYRYSCNNEQKSLSIYIYNNSNIKLSIPPAFQSGTWAVCVVRQTH